MQALIRRLPMWALHLLSAKSRFIPEAWRNCALMQILIRSSN